MKKLALSMAAKAAFVATQAVVDGRCWFFLYEEKIPQEILERLKNKEKASKFGIHVG